MKCNFNKIYTKFIYIFIINHKNNKMFYFTKITVSNVPNYIDLLKFGFSIKFPTKPYIEHTKWMDSSWDMTVESGGVGWR